MPELILSDLAHAAFPHAGHPDVLVSFPDNIDVEHLGLVLYLHGFDNCVVNVNAPSPGPHAPHPASDLSGQLQRAGRSAMLVLLETRYHAENGDPGALGQPGGLRALLNEVLDHVAPQFPQLAAVTISSFVHTVLVSHSGGYRAAARMAERGGLPIQEVCLLDSLYGELPTFLSFADSVVAERSAGGSSQRLVNLYRGGTAEGSQQLAEHITSQLRQRGLPPELLAFDADASACDDQLLGRPLVIKRVDTEHSELALTYFGRLLTTSGLPGALPQSMPADAAAAHC